MASRLYRALLLSLYQLSIISGIALLPVALVTRQLGLSLPIGRLVERVGRAYENA